MDKIFNVSKDPQENINEAIKSMLSPVGVTTNAGKRLQAEIDKYKGLMADMDKFIKETHDSQAFQTAAKPILGELHRDGIGWVEQPNQRWYFYSDGTAKNSDGKTFAKGEKVTGWYKDLTASRYYYLSSGETKNSAGEVFKNGEMVTGWYKEGNKWYYLTPEPRKNKEGSTFKTGELIFGTLSIKDKGKGWIQYKFNNDGSLQE
ncbi:hypothetical protein CN404_30860 [Bacillus thuringiensis]|uniref:hypothetical protein n=1 Tax=Bacillus thuringiensis TaxID=1428 RepID=UPI000BF3C669|nr:hypothetical protein [Bacillus thuringiensis]PFB38970.1 hypothetical protein CN404_30860 [Bacillus thuringiensis]